MRDTRVSRPAKSAGLVVNRGRPSAVDAGRLGAERHRIELALGALQDLQAACPLGVLVIQVLLVVAADLVRAGG